MDRRTFLLGSLAGFALLPLRSDANSSRTRLILLGTGGGPRPGKANPPPHKALRVCGCPRPRKANSAPAQVLLVNDVAYVIDCGDGVARQLALADVPLSKL